MVLFSHNSGITFLRTQEKARRGLYFFRVENKEKEKRNLLNSIGHTLKKKDFKMFK